MKDGLERAALTSVRLAVVVFSFVWLGFIAHERGMKYINNGIVHRRSYESTSRPWFEMAVCFGPTVTGDLVENYINQIMQLVEDRYAYYEEHFATNDGYPITVRIMNATMAIDSVRAYREFFGNRYNWTDDIYALSWLTADFIGKFVPAFEHYITLGGVEFNQSLTYSDIPFVFRYSWCRNFTYTNSYRRGKASRTKVASDFIHQIYINKSTHRKLFMEGLANYMDLYIYPRGDFTEFPLIADHIPYRLDLSSHKLLSVVGEKTDKKERAGVWQCNNDRQHSYVNCLTWCLVRGLLGKVRCIMPLLIPYIYNTTGRIPYPKDLNPWTLASGRVDMRWSTLHPPNSSWPWMTDYTNLSLCNSKEDFLHMFDKYTSVFYPRGKERYPLSPNCSKECLPNCSSFKVLINSAGTKVIPDFESGSESETNEQHQFPHGVTAIHSTSLNIVKEHWIYSWQHLFIDMSGVVSFLLGMSLIAIHEWCVALSQWSLGRVGLLDLELDEDEEESEVEDEEEQPVTIAPGLLVPQVIVQPPSDMSLSAEQTESQSDVENADNQLSL